MQNYDVALKLLLRGSAKLTMRELTGRQSRLRDLKEAVRRIVENIKGSAEIDREVALHLLLILAGLRGLEDLVVT